MNRTTLCQHRQGPELNRRQWLARSSAGFGTLALRSLMAEDVEGSTGLIGAPHYPARAKRVIFSFHAWWSLSYRYV